MTTLLARRTPAVSGRWERTAALVAATAAGILLLHRRDAADMAYIWWTSSAFGHCVIVVPILAWLVWQRREALARTAPAAWWPPLALAALGAAAWLAGDVAGVALARHLGLVMMLQGAAMALIGRDASRLLAFPLAYALFLVPAGEQLIAPLQTLTARMSTALLDLAGVPARLDGVFITTADGRFEVAEACSGIGFLIAMAAYAVLVAHLCFRSWRRRAIFVAAALAAPALANGVRATGVILLAHATSVERAAGVDHIVYGWLFFAAVIAGVTAAAWPFFERQAGEIAADSPANTLMSSSPRKRGPSISRSIDSSAGELGSRFRGNDDELVKGEFRNGRPTERGAPSRWVPAFSALLIAAAPLGWSTLAAARGYDPLARQLHLPQVAGWRRVAIGGVGWTPSFDAPDHRLIGRYRDARGREVDLALIAYARQAEGRELVGFGHGAAGPANGWSWAADLPAPAAGRAERIVGPGGLVREAALFYRVGDVTTGSAARVKIETMRVRLTGGSPRAAALIVSAEARPGRPARGAIDAFLAALGPPGAAVDGILR